jgi:tetratricopeptide (TPR) repeat protein
MTLDAATAVREIARGNDAFAHGAYGDAVAAYEGAVAAGARSGDVLYNLGNAYYRAGRVGHAALAWERALREDPADADALHNLGVVRSASADRVLAGDDPFLVRLGTRTDPDLAAGALLVLWTLVWALLLARRRLVRPFLRAAALAVIAVLAVGSVLAGGAVWATRAVRDDGFAVVVADAAVHEAPDAKAKESFQVHEGLRLRALERSGGFTRVTLPGGLTGWLPAEALQAIGEKAAPVPGPR